MIKVSDGGGCDDKSDRWVVVVVMKVTDVVVVMMKVTDG